MWIPLEQLVEQTFLPGLTVYQAWPGNVGNVLFTFFPSAKLFSYNLIRFTIRFTSKMTPISHGDFLVLSPNVE